MISPCKCARQAALVGHAGRMGAKVDIEPLQPTIAGDAVADLMERLGRSRLGRPATDGWERGVPTSWLADLLADWQAFDVASLQARLDRLPHLVAEVDRQRLHLLHVPGQGLGER
jgi:epoxide hydrolase